jgi:hypothetical protein
MENSYQLHAFLNSMWHWIDYNHFQSDTSIQALYSLGNISTYLSHFIITTWTSSTLSPKRKKNPKHVIIMSVKFTISQNECFLHRTSAHKVYITDRNIYRNLKKRKEENNERAVWLVRKLKRRELERKRNSQIWSHVTVGSWGLLFD